jgi:hypothetical protein
MDLSPRHAFDYFEGRRAFRPPQHTSVAIVGAGLARIGGYALFFVVYAPILTTQRTHTKTAHL